MASSSIEVMGVLMDDGGPERDMEQMQTIIASTNDQGQLVSSLEAQPISSHETEEEDFATMGGDFHTLEGMEPPPGTIIFSPQDLMRPPKSSGRGRPKSQPRSVLANIKQEPGGATPMGGGHNLEMPVACEICGKVMMTGKTLVQHMAIHSDLKPFQCPHCPKSFARKVHLQGHLVVHGIEKQFECPVCHQRFSRQDCVKVHMRLHDKSKCVYCDVCHKAFLTVGALNIHLRIHRGEKPFKCHLCGKCFTQKNHLITHIKRHTKVTDEHFTKKLGPRMFKCEHCPRAFIRLSDYERHVQWNHGAVAEGSVVDKLPTVSNLLEGEMKQTGVAPQIFKAPKDAINNKPRVKRAQSRKVMCTTSTQTDSEGGHVIIPRKYQNTVSAGTQVSAPPTPRPADEDMYENDIFDEGMDRNYSSDEDEDYQNENEEDPLERKVFSIPQTNEMSSDPIQDAAFDAIVHSSTKTTHEQEVDPSGDEHAEFLREVVSSITRQALENKQNNNDSQQAQEENDAQQRLSVDRGREEISEESIDQENVIDMETVNDPLAASPTKMEAMPLREPVEEAEEVVEQSQENQVSPQTQQLQALTQNSAFHMDMSTRDKLIRGVGRRPRGRVRKAVYGGLTGAAELRAIRKNMRNMLNAFAAEAENEKTNSDPDEPEPEPEPDPLIAAETDDAKCMDGNATEDGETEGRGKRLAKNKQHGKDFVCNMKNCETCFSTSQKPIIKSQAKIKIKIKEKDVPEVSQIRKSIPGTQSVPTPQPIKKLIPFLHKEPIKQQLVKDMAKLPEKRPNFAPVMPNSVNRNEPFAKKFKDERKVEETKMKVDNRVGSYPVNITANPLSNQGKKDDYFVTTSNADSIVSPPVELMSFCIPTYSCKLCGREFRFEGKLHRHIESVHQNKAIFSPDVKPGRGSLKPLTVNPLERDVLSQPPSSPDEGQQQQPQPQPQQHHEPENPEIAALRSEWDDDDEDDDELEPSVISAAPVVSSFSAVAPIPAPIVTREIAPVATTISDAYSSGVKVNMNKLAGLLPAGRTIPISSTGRIKDENMTPVTSVSNEHHPREPETIMADTLDMKCRRLLEKLFDHELLLSCGLVEEHVSIVLGRVLQHYGVKMIEDYGQGQYEVLKYNLWRLIEWKVTMEQMEEFYTAGKSVEEMMDDIMNERVPIVSHNFVPQEQAAPAQQHTQVSQAGPQVTQVEAVDVGNGQMVLQQVAGVLGGQINLPEGVTQVVLAQDVPPDLLQGAHIVTIDPATGRVISQVAADQVILTDAMGDELEQQVAALDGQVVVSQPHIVSQSASQGNMVVTHSSALPVQAGQADMSHGQVIVAPQQTVKMEGVANPSTHHHHHHHQ